MKKNLVTALIASTLAMTTSAYAILPGFYVGAQPGYSMLHYNNSTLNATTSSINNNGFGARVYGGYQFSQTWSTELGFEQFAVATFSNVTANNGVSNIYGTAKINAIDLVGKLTYPLSNSGFEVFGKLGGAYTIASISNVISNNGGPNSTNKFLFTYGLGLSYDICPEIGTDLTWMRIQNSGSNNNTTSITNADLFSAGISYYFG